MDGSEPGEIVAAAVLSGAPVDLQARQVRCVRYIEDDWQWRHIDAWSEYTGRRKQPLNREHGTVTIGEWTGTFCRKVIGGKIR